MNKSRCVWAVNGTPKELVYHDKEWGMPCYDDSHLFEMLVLEGAQAGLSWSTILGKRDAFRIHYDAFNPETIATWTDEKIEQLMQEPSIIRNRLKIKSAMTNAQTYLKILEQHNSFSDYLWQFVDNKPIQNHWKTHKDLPAFTTQSEMMAKTLHKDGFRFVGKTICYALMQAVGMVNDHTTDCFRYSECKAAS